MLINFFGDATRFTVPSQDLPGEAITYNTISAAIEANAVSRIFGGVHVPSSGVISTPVPNVESLDPDRQITLDRPTTDEIITETITVEEQELLTVETNQGFVLLRVEQDAEVQLGRTVAESVMKSFGN
ncbi:hypothetical protein [Nostoc sp. CCY0012]|uniref:hypothetical protein n=1 Tax=Nostoc sp. CCY0012 TaxID=1056123 RepID=UPI0039C5CBD9